MGWANEFPNRISSKTPAHGWLDRGAAYPTARRARSMTKSYRRGTGFSLFRTLSGPGLLALGFAAGALFAMVPAYYLYRAHDLALPGAAGESSAGPAQTSEGGKLGRPAREAELPKRFAPRLTYELSRPPASPAKSPAQAPSPEKTATASASAPAPPTRAKSAQDLPTSKVANARPIYPTPPDPRDTTREIEKETRRAYRQPPPAPAVQPRIIEGRDLVLPPKPQDKAPSDRQTVAAAGPAVSGVSPISPPAGASDRRPSGAPQARPSAASGGARAAAPDVKSRLTATRNWLLTAAPSTHTIQLMGVNNDTQLAAHLQTLAKVLEPSKIYVFRTVAQGKPSVTVIYGSYADRKAALEALQKLPPAIVANRPVLRTVKGIRAEMVQNRTDS
jgi:septal ring-binding cell division protein DamX